MESLIVSLEVFCFKQNLFIKQFFDSIYSMYWAAEKLNIPLENFPEYIEQMKVKKDNLIDQIQRLESEKQTSLESYHTTKEGLEYRNEGHYLKKPTIKTGTTKAKTRSRQIQNRARTYENSET